MKTDDLDMLDAEFVGGTAKENSSSWWKWLLGLGAAAGIGYFLVQDIWHEDLLPNPVPSGPRPWGRG